MLIALRMPLSCVILLRRLPKSMGARNPPENVMEPASEPINNFFSDIFPV